MATIFPRLEMKSALEHFSSQGNCLKMTTGSGGARFTDRRHSRRVILFIQTG